METIYQLIISKLFSFNKILKWRQWTTGDESQCDKIANYKYYKM